MDPRFLSFSEVISIHDQEIGESGGSFGIRDSGLLESAIEAPKASLRKEFLMDLYEMAATYVYSLAFNHPFIDGNKRTALAAGLTFLFMNGYEVDETYDEELADKVLNLISHKLSKSDFALYLKNRSRNIF